MNSEKFQAIAQWILSPVIDLSSKSIPKDEVDDNEPEKSLWNRIGERVLLTLLETLARLCRALVEWPVCHF